MWDNTDNRSDADQAEWEAEVGQQMQQEQRDAQDDPLFQMMVELMRRPME